VMAVKAFATSSTNSGGGVAGDFAPTLFAGAVCGFFFAKTAGALFGADLPVADFACYGMAAVMAGAVRAPLMAMFIVTEMTCRPEALPPAAIAAAVAYAVARMIERARE
ncbi:MAG: chloride channel protein, partial [Muribaculaceae bacterium]|nr:chloride channel protein [Muribaculaceae bacterium]